MTLAAHAANTAHAANQLPGRHARTVTALAHLLARRLPTAQRMLTLELGALDGYPTTASGSDQGPRGSGGVSRPTERLALLRDGNGNGPAIDVADLYETVMGARDAVHHAQHEHDELNRDDWLQVAVSLLRQAHHICDRHAPPADIGAADRLRCVGTGDAAGATCSQIRDYRLGDDGTVHPNGDGRCLDCRQKVAQAEADKAASDEARRRRKAARLTRSGR